MIYRPGKGAMWDPSILWHDGRYHAFMMYNRDGVNGLEAGHCLLAVSEDGVHWRDEAVVIEEPERAKNWRFFKCFIGRCGDRFIMDHGVARPEGQDMLRFYESADLRNWRFLFSNRPDPRWYGLPPELHRWDHMYLLAKEEGNPKAGYWGFPVSAPKPFDRGGVGMMQSADGRSWEVLPPAPIEYPKDLPVANHFEWGGCERVGTSYYLIGGGGYLGYKGYGIYSFRADAPTGPFRPDQETVRLCGNSHVNISWLAAWCRGKDELLISNYASSEPGNLSPWLLPLRKPVLDGAGRLRLAWWKGNEALKGKRIILKSDSLKLAAVSNAYAVAVLDLALNERKGFVIEGRILARAAGNEAAAGPVLVESDSTVMAVLSGVGKPGARETRIGRLTTGGEAMFEVMDVTGKHCATVTGIEDGKEHAFRLLARIGIFELYIDDLLMQTFFYTPGAGKVGVAAHNAGAQVTGLNAWEMSL